MAKQVTSEPPDPRTVNPGSDPVFRLQIVHPDGSGVRFDGASQFERDLVTACRVAIVARGVGFGRTEAHVAKDIEDGIREVLLGLKRETLRIL